MDEADLRQTLREFSDFMRTLEPAEQAEYERMVSTYIERIIHGTITRQRGRIDDIQSTPTPQGGGSKTTSATFTCPCCDNDIAVTLTC